MSNKLPSKINVVGVSGSGKSTFAKQLADVLNLSYYEMDELFWKPNWQFPDEDEFTAKIEKVISKDSWVLDGNYSKTTPLKWKNADTVIWVDLSFPRTLWQSLKRAFIRAYTQEEIWKGTGNKESFRKSFFSKSSIILWMLQNYFPVKKRYVKAMETNDYPDVTFVRLRSHRQMKDYLDRLRNS